MVSGCYARIGEERRGEGRMEKCDFLWWLGIDQGFGENSGA